MADLSRNLRPPAIALHQVTHTLGGRRVLDGVDLEVHRGTSVAVTGPSGSGKSTLLLGMAGLLTPDRGEVRLNGTALGSLRQTQRTALRLSTVGVVYQFGELLPELSPIENVTLPALLSGVKVSTAAVRARELMDSLGIGDRAEADTATLSGGERQRVAVARALMSDPAVVLADEPTGALDEEATEAVASLLYDLPRERGCALVLVTHNRTVAQRADLHLALRRGVLVSETATVVVDG